jgi:septal ring factor EnvC (AmiA/AmiB activator)
MSLFGKKSDDTEHENGSAPPRHRGGYGIDDAIQLMRTLPVNQQPDLVLLVVRNTLASMNVDLRQVIDSGSSKQERLNASVAKITTAIAELENEINARKQELAKIEADLAETSAVKDRLEMAARWAEAGQQPGVSVAS